MDKCVRCECGYSVVGADFADLVRRFCDHARGQHGMEVTEAHVLALAEPVGPATALLENTRTLDVDLVGIPERAARGDAAAEDELRRTRDAGSD